MLLQLYKKFWKIGEARNRANARQFIVPTEQEDAALTAAAMSDPDAIPFTDAQWAQVKVKRGPGRPTQEATKYRPVSGWICAW
jgi:hypothetical protein